MKKRLGIVIAIVLALIVCSLLIWRLWPHSFEDVISTDESNITSLACTTTISGLNGDGTTFISSYELQSLGKDEEEFTAVLDILKSCEYRQDFQNLFPWAITSVESDSSRAAQVFLAPLILYGVFCLVLEALNRGRNPTAAVNEFFRGGGVDRHHRTIAQKPAEV